MQKLDRSYLDELRTGVLLLDRFLKIKYLNPSAQSLLDTSFKSSKNKNLKELFFEESEDFDSFLENLNNKTTFQKLIFFYLLRAERSCYVITISNHLKMS